MSDREEDEHDAPEEFTAEQGVQQDEALRKIQIENKARVVREGKERRRKWAQRLTPRPSKTSKDSQDVSGAETQQVSTADAGLLPDNVVQMLAARENRQVLLSDSDDEQAAVKPTSKKKKSKKTGCVICSLEPVNLSEIGPPPCLQRSLEFLKKRKMEVSRSSSVLNNSNQALRLLSSSGVLGRK
ncbi:uncharacterized protein G2W53_036520 [Senna tora]|uniref:Uncharacterized protein n=1 Tax=Senna tora TaxID=362788 RepID=A0A834SXK5_9FABA|nr:uncharacterized protein G2W53_036520 [Senna tora]